MSPLGLIPAPQRERIAREADKRIAAYVTPARPELTYAEGLLPKLPGYTHGVVGKDPWRLQCDACGAIETPEHLILMDTRFVHGDPRRLCGDCRVSNGYPRVWE